MIEDRNHFREILTASGWHPSRRVEIEDVISTWREFGHEPSPAAIDFVSNFNGITFSYPKHKATGGTDHCILDAATATRAIYPSVVRGYEKRVHEVLCPVGLAASRHINLMVSPSNKVYGGYDSFLALYGNESLRALQNIFLRIRGAPVED